MNLLIKWLSIGVATISILLAVYSNFISTSDSKISGTFTEQDTSDKRKFTDEMAEAQSLYDFKYVNIDGEETSMEKYRGHVLIVVNVASKCGFTCVNYQELTELFDKYSETEGLRILAFPCNQFGGQEPLGEKEIKEFVKEYNVRYDMASKTNVNGDNTHPLWSFLKDKKRGILNTTLVKWNFTKFLVDKKGNVLQRYSPNTNPKAMEKDIIEAFKS